MKERLLVASVLLVSITWVGPPVLSGLQLNAAWDLRRNTLTAPTSPLPLRSIKLSRAVGGSYQIYLPLIQKPVPDLLPCVTTGDPPVTYGCLITTVAGNGPPNVGDRGPANEAILEGPLDVLVAPDGGQYIVDTYNNRVRYVTPGGIIQTIAGTGTAENQQLGDGLPATDAQLRLPRGLALGSDGSLYVADTNHYLVRRIDPDGIIATFAGNRNPFYFGEGIPAIQASFASPRDVVIDPQGNIYIADTASNRVRRIDRDGIVWTIAGTGDPGSSGDGGPATQAELNAPKSVALDAQNNLLIGTSGGNAIRRVELSTGIITSVPNAYGAFVATDDAGNIIFSDGNQVKRMEAATGDISVIAGTGQSGFSGDGGSATKATLQSPAGLSVDALGNVYVADSLNDRVRVIRTDGTIETLAGGGVVNGDGLPAKDAGIYDSSGLTFDTYGNLFFTDFTNQTIRKLDNRGIVTTVAGNSHATTVEDGGKALQTYLGPPMAPMFDDDGNLLFIDPNNSVGVVRLITPGANGVIDGSPDETVITIAGQMLSRDEADRGSADGGPAKSAVFSAARGLTIDSRGNLYIADAFDHRVRMVTPGSDGVFNGGPDEIITTIAGNGVAASTGDGGLATQASIWSPLWLAVDSDDNLYINERAGTWRIRRVDAVTGIITTYAETRLDSFVFDALDNLYIADTTQLYRLDAQTGIQAVIAGTGEFGFGGDGGDALQATFRGVQYVTFDQQENLYIVDNGNFRIRMMTFFPLP